MTKFHIGKKGTPTRCRAKDGNCPFGGESQHYDNIQDAKEAIENKNTKQHDVFASSKKKKDVLSKEEFTENMLKIISNGNLSNVENDVYNFFNENSDSIFNIIRKRIEDSDNLEDNARDYIRFTNESLERLADVKLDSLDKETKEHLLDSMDELKDGDNLVSFSEIDELSDYDMPKDYREKIISLGKTIPDNTRNSALKDLSEILDDENIETIRAKDIGNGFVNITLKDRDWETRKYNVVVYMPDEESVNYLDDNKIYFGRDFYQQPYYNAKVFDKLTDKEVSEVIDKGLIHLVNYDGIPQLGSDASKYEKMSHYMNRELHKEGKAISDSIKKNYLKAEKARAIIDKESYLENNFGDIKIEHVGNTDIEKAEFFKTAAPKTGERKDVSKLLNDLEKDDNFKNVQYELSGKLAHSRLDKTSLSDEELNNLDYNIAGLDKKEKIAIGGYSTGYYGIYTSAAFNSRFEDDSSFTPEKAQQHMDEINSAIQKMQKGNKEKRILYRGFAGPEHMNAQQFIESYEIGDEVATQKVTSTSLDPTIARKFSNKAKHCPSIFVYNSRKGAYIKSLSSVTSEEEVVMPVGEKMVVTHKEVNEDGIAVIYLSDSE